MIFALHLALLFALLLESSFDGITVFLTNYVIGFVLAMTVLRMLPQKPGREEKALFVPKPARILKFIGNLSRFSWDFVKDLTLSNIAVARDVWAPHPRYKPVFVEVPTHDLTDFETVVLANRITLTPGTLSAAISKDRHFILVHAMYDGGPTQPADLRRPIELLKEGL